MKLQGVVRNVVDFGAFVDIGLKNDGLIHISKMSSHKVKHALDVCHVGDILDVYVYDVDLKKKKSCFIINGGGINAIYILSAL